MTDAEPTFADAWSRVAEGANAVVVGSRSPGDPQKGLAAVRVDCGHTRGPLGLVRELLVRLAGELGGHASRWLPEAVRRDAGLGRRLLDEAPERIWGQALRAALVELAESARAPTALVFEGVDEAPDDVCKLLADLATLAPEFGVPVLLAFGSAEPARPGPRALLDAMRDREGERALVRATAPPEPVEPGPASEAPEPPALPDELRRVLRALALAQPDVEIAALATLLDLEPLRLLEQLQLAHDLGVPIEESGDGRVALEASFAAELARTALPSLAREYHRRLATWYGAAKESEERGKAGAEARAHAAKTDALGAASEPFAPRREEAASYAAAAGEAELAASEYAGAVDEAADLGLYEQALGFGQQALDLLDDLPEDDSRRRLRARLLVSLARVHWLAAGLASGLSLGHATKLLDAAGALFRPGDSFQDAAAIDALRACVLYDVGSPEALEQALDAVTRASRALGEGGDALRAARLINEEAAIWVRIGDVVRAHHLLERSLEVFGSVEGEEARLEAAETHHLLARLVFHVPARDGRESDALEVSLEHARAAETCYEELDRVRQLARVRETLGRLELLAGRVEEAEGYLRASAESQQELADPIGLARTAAALAELSAARGDATTTLEMLGDSVRLNKRSGSSIGLAYNRRALESLEGRVPEVLADRFDALRGELEQAEKSVSVQPGPSV